MKNLSLYIAEILGEQNIIQQDEVAQCRYGLEVFSTSVLETLSILLLSLFFKNFVYTTLFFVAFIPLRIYAGGYHANTKLRCYAVFLAVYAMFSLTIQYAATDNIPTIGYISTILTAILVCTFAPIIHNKKRANKSETSIFRKISITIMFVESIIILIGLHICPANKFILSFILGQFAVSLSVIAALIKQKLGGESYEIQKNYPRSYGMLHTDAKHLRLCI